MTEQPKIRRPSHHNSEEELTTMIEDLYQQAGQIKLEINIAQTKYMTNQNQELEIDRRN